MDIKILYPGFKTKAVTMSFDDGTFYDVMLVNFLNSVGFKATFHLNSGMFLNALTLPWKKGDIFLNRLSPLQYKYLYSGHEVAGHTVSHPHLNQQNIGQWHYQVTKDLADLSDIFEYNVNGFAIPFGTYNNKLLSFLSDKVLYARTTNDTNDFAVPQTFVPLHPSAWAIMPSFAPLCKRYATENFSQISWFFIWGHSYEFALDEDFELFKNSVMPLAKQPDIFYATTGQIVNYLNAARKLIDSKQIEYNNSGIDLYFNIDGNNKIVHKN